jgi:hypothetical protein
VGLENTPSVGRAETEKFVDYWRAKPGQAAMKRDWVATWRNWMSRAQEDAERRGGGRTAQATKASRIEALDAFLTDDQDQAAGHLRAVRHELDSQRTRGFAQGRHGL